MAIVGVPVKLLHESTGLYFYLLSYHKGHVVTVELKTGIVYRGKLLDSEDNMNIQMKDITVTARDGRVSQLEQVFVRGSQLRYIIVPDMLKNAPMFKRFGPSANKGRGIGLGRGRGAGGRGGPAMGTRGGMGGARVPNPNMPRRA